MNESRAITDILRCRPPLQIGAIADSSLLRKSCEAVLARWPNQGNKKSPDDAEAILFRVYYFIRGWQENRPTEKLRMADIRSAAVYAFDAEWNYPGLPKQLFTEIRDFLLRELKYNTEASFIAAMGTSFLENYAPSQPDMQRLGVALGAAISRLEARGEIWKWQQFFRAFPQSLSGENSAPQIAAILLNEEKPRQALTEKCGLQLGDDANIMQYINSAYIQRMKGELENIAAVRAVLNWLSPDGSKDKAQMQNASLAIEALLAPWQHKEPPDTIQAILLERLIKFYGDPRLTKGGVWAETGADCKNLLIRWLTKENMLFFLQVVSQVEGSHMWEPRRKFWLGLYEAGIIDSAWVGFSEPAKKVAMQLKDVQERRDFGLQTAGGSRWDTSILVMQIGEAVVVEGSHSYKVQILK